MKYVFQFGIIAVISFIAELLYKYLPLPIPASIYGLVIMLVLLVTGVIKAEWVRETAKYLILIMPLMFIPAGAKLITVKDMVLPIILPLLFTVIVTTVIVMAVSGHITQLIIRRGKNGK